MKTKPKNKTNEASRRQEAFQEMNTALQELSKKVDDKVAIAIKGPVKVAYSIGLLIKEAIGKDGTYGPNAIELIAAYTMIPGGVRTLDDYRKLVETFDQAAIDQHMAEPMANGKPLSVYHLIETCSIASARHRLELLALIRNKCLSVEDLRHEIAARGLRSSTKKGGGRKPKPPVTPIAGLHKLFSHTERLREYAVVCETVFDRIEKMPPDDMDSDLLKQVEAAQTSTAEAVECLHNVNERLQEAKDRVQRVLSLTKNKAMPQPV